MYIQKGFTLIELLTIMAVISILAAIAIPIYQNYTSRAQVSEAMIFADAMKTKLLVELTNNSCNSESAIGTYGKAESGGIAPNCTITYTFNNTNVTSALKSKTLILDISPDGGFTVNSATTIDNKYLPDSFR